MQQPVMCHSKSLHSFQVDDSVVKEPEDKDESPVAGEPQDMSEFDIQLAAKTCACSVF